MFEKPSEPPSPKDLVMGFVLLFMLMYLIYRLRHRISALYDRVSPFADRVLNPISTLTSGLPVPSLFFKVNSQNSDFTLAVTPASVADSLLRNLVPGLDDIYGIFLLSRIGMSGVSRDAFNAIRETFLPSPPQAQGTMVVYRPLPLVNIPHGIDEPVSGADDSDFDEDADTSNSNNAETQPGLRRRT